MSLPRLLIIFSLVLFGAIGIAALFKSGRSSSEIPVEIHSYEVSIERDLEPQKNFPAPVSFREEQGVIEKKSLENPKKENARSDANLPEADRIAELFNKADPRLPIVETITYKSVVPWQKGRPAWLSSYAAHYATSRHFIARSLNGKPDYFKQDVAEGDRFNVFRLDKNFQFYLLIDTSRCKMWFYYIDLDQGERVLLKTYQVGLGRIDSSRLSGLLTPLGKYRLGDKIAIYKPKTIGIHNGQKVEMIRIFGTRWIPFDQEIGNCTAPAKGFGIHGVPWIPNEKGDLAANDDSLGKYESDGCIRLSTEDMEELFAIIITKPAVIELVRDFYDAELPGEPAKSI